MTIKTLDLLAIQLICDSYNGDNGVFDQTLEVENVKVHTKSYEDFFTVIFPGSQTFIDWQRDFEALMVTDKEIGQVEDGFMEGMRAVVSAISLPTTKNILIAGHSLGAARALIYGALLAVKNLADMNDTIVTFGSPRPGGQKIKDILSPLTIRSYRNRHDPVTTVPFFLPDFPYMHPRDLMPIDVKPSYPNAWGLLADHHSELYLKGMEGLFLKPAESPGLSHCC